MGFSSYRLWSGLFLWRPVVNHKVTEGEAVGRIPIVMFEAAMPVKETTEVTGNSCKIPAEWHLYHITAVIRRLSPEMTVKHLIRYPAILIEYKSLLWSTLPREKQKMLVKRKRNSAGASSLSNLLSVKSLTMTLCTCTKMTPKVVGALFMSLFNMWFFQQSLNQPSFPHNP